MKEKMSNIVVEVIVCLLILLWIYTGLNKIIDYSKFKFEVGRSPFLQNFALFIALTLPAWELIMAVLLVFKRIRNIGLYASLFMMTLFTGYVYIMLKYSYDLPCSCGGIIEKLTWEQHLAVNFGVTILTIMAIFLQSSMVTHKKLATHV
ncbi:MauE/DoxX family redox-associated membrane protein [Chitinophaga sp. S165]|uniref:MauE/DoxX family redox-associated membrane protein n=1 Tax=Chitinophaga sp. S165 TaxID=2135462 RepID=UPI000D70BF45|nr:hypothetical protein C7475_11924 [Chitinophaga sp. S165]